MAAITSAVVVAAGTAYAANKQAGAAKNAANKAGRAADAAQARLEENYQRTADQLNPYIDAGQSALTNINQVNAGNYAAFENSPDYQYALSSGINAADRSAAARGSLFSGGQQADLLKLGQGLASQNLNTYYNRQLGLAQLGQNSATSLGSIGTGNAAAQGNIGMNAAAAQGQAGYDRANANASLVSGLTGAFGQYLGGMGGAGAQASSYGSPAAQQSAGVLGGGQYNGPGSLSTSWSNTPNYFRTA